MPSYELWRHPGTGRWYITWTEQGRSHRLSTRTQDRGRAEKLRAAFVLERDQPERAAADQATIADILDSYYERRAKRLPSEQQARIAIAHLKTFYGAGRVVAITERSHERYRTLCESEGVGAATINRRRAVLRAALRFAVRSGDLASAPFIPTEREPEPRPDALTREQAAALLKAARDFPHVAMFIQLAIYTGARRGAILDLTWSRVDLDLGMVDFRLPGIDHSRKRRAVTALPAKLVSGLRRAKARSRSRFVIAYKGAGLKSIKRAFKSVAIAARLPWVTPHVLKHTAVTWGLRVASPWHVQGMTATSVRTLQRVYGKHLAEDLRQTVEAIAHSKTRKLRVSPPHAKAPKRLVGATGIEPVTPTMRHSASSSDAIDRQALKPVSNALRNGRNVIV